jgi:TetR/AcrR family transcriptional regulator
MNPPFTSTPQGEERRQEILRQAIDVFGEAGYGGARIDEVARRVGIRRPSILYHFPDKQSLYEAAVTNIVSEIVDLVLASEGDNPDRLETIADAWIDFVIARPSAARVLLRQMIDSNPIPIRNIQSSVQKLLSSIQAAIDERLGIEDGKSADATEFALVLSSTSLVWVASHHAVEGALGLDTMSPESIQRHRRVLHALTRQLLAASAEAGSAEPKRPSAKKTKTDRAVKRAGRKAKEK